MADCLNTILQNMLQYFREIAAEILSSLIRHLLLVKQGEPRTTSIPIEYSKQHVRLGIIIRHLVNILFKY